MGPALQFDDHSSRRTWSAGALSIVAHLGLFWVIAAGAAIRPPEEPLSPLRFVGQTFDVDALGEDDQDEASPSGDESSPHSSPPLEETPPDSETSDDESEPTPPPEPEEAQRETEAEPEYHAPAPPPFPRKFSASATEEAPETSSRPTAPKPTTPQMPVDPFDMGLPGEPSPGASSSTPSETGSYGAEGDTAPVTDVFKAFLHLFPEANRHDPAWHELSVGPVGRIEFFLTIGKNARLVSIQVERDDASPPPKILIDAIRKTQTYLHHQRLGWEGERREGRQRLALTVKVEKKSPHSSAPDRTGTQRHGRYGESRPTGAFFTYYDGHHIDIELERLP